MRLKGTLIEWNDARGFGFIEPADGGGRVFCHVKAFAIRLLVIGSGERMFSHAECRELNAKLDSMFEAFGEGVYEAAYPVFMKVLKNLRPVSLAT